MAANVTSTRRPWQRSASTGLSAGGTAEPAHPGDAALPQVAPTPPKLRRRPAVIAGTVAAAVAGAVLSAWAYTSIGTAQDVVAVRSSIARGQVIAREALMTARISVDPALTPLPGDQLDTIVGQRAAVDLSAGGLVTADSVTAAPLPGKGASVVGVALSPSAMPAEALLSGDRVRIVATPGQQGDVSVGDQRVIDAEVVGVRGLSDGSGSVVDVQVPQAQAAELAARAATGKVALVLDSRER